jgi:hypothetical protein
VEEVRERAAAIGNGDFLIHLLVFPVFKNAKPY